MNDTRSTHPGYCRNFTLHPLGCDHGCCGDELSHSFNNSLVGTMACAYINKPLLHSVEPARLDYIWFTIWLCATWALKYFILKQT